MMPSVSIFLLWLLGSSEERAFERIRPNIEEKTWEISKKDSYLFISARLSTGSVLVGQDATIFCWTNCPPGNVQLKQNGNFKNDGRIWKKGYYEFYGLNVKIEHGGEYNCCCRMGYPYYLYETSTKCSEPVELLITDPDLPRPNIFLSPSRSAVLGSHVTIKCWTRDQNENFYLHKAGAGLKPRAMEANGKTAVFHIKNVSRSDGGNYSCRYRSQFVVSHPSDTEVLWVLEDTSMVNAIASGVGVAVLVLFLGLGAFLWYKKRRVGKRQSTAPISGEPSFRVMKVDRKATSDGISVNESGQQKDLPPEQDSTTETQNVIYAELKHKAPPVQSDEDSADDSDDCIYTELRISGNQD